MQDEKFELSSMLREAVAVQQELKEGEEVKVKLDCDFRFEKGPADNSAPDFDADPPTVASIAKDDDVGVVYEKLYDTLMSSKTGNF